MEQQIPEPPEKRTINSEDYQRLERWIRYFRNLSSKVRIFLPKGDNFKKVLISARKVADENLPDSTLYHISDWPKDEDIAFLVTIDSANPGNPTEYRGYNTYIFCFGYAFGITYHQGDSDMDGSDDTKSFSLRHYSSSSLSWEYVTKRIIDKVEELSDLVPESPSVE